MEGGPRRARLSLTRYLFLWITALCAGAVLIVSVLWGAFQYQDVREQHEERVLTMAESVAVMPMVKEALLEEDPSMTLAPWAETIRASGGFEYIMIADSEGIRQSHPDPSAIGGRPSLDPAPVLAGETWTGVEHGHAGLTLRARVPIRASEGTEVIGYVSVGILASEVQLASFESLPLILGVTVLIVGLGALGAHVLSRRIRAKTHGLEPEEIAGLYDGREALLFAIGEGVIALDRDARISLANAPARELLDLPEDHLGGTPLELRLEADVVELLSAPQAGRDELLAVGGRILVCNRRPVRVHEAESGVVVTLRDQTELTQLNDQLDGAHTVTNGLRAQRHEFANRIHTVAGMLELGAVEEARSYLDELSLSTSRANSEIAERIGDLAVGALALAKSVQAAEQGTSFELAPMSRLPENLPPDLRDDLLLVVGNLVDNALDVAGPQGWVELLVRHHSGHSPDGHGAGTDVVPPDEIDQDLPPELVEVRVIDSGPGIDPELGERLFAAGSTTKEGSQGDRRGLGLALVRQTCLRRGGSVDVDDDGETTFVAYLPVMPVRRPRGRAGQLSDPSAKEASA